jgi:tyrosine-protein kinase Etk/Wzc
MTTTNQPSPADPASNGGGPGRSDEISLVEIGVVLLRNRRLLVALPLVLAAGVGIVALAQDRTYRATASFIPQVAERSTSGAAALARQFGMNIGTDRPGQSPQFYADLLRGREVLRQAVEAEYRVAVDGVSREATLIELFDVADDTGPLPPWRRAVERLREDLSVGIARETGVVQLTVSAATPELAEQIAEQLLGLLNKFNLETRQGQALEEGRFVAARMAEAQEELREAEDALKTFLQQNRQFTNSPELVFEHERLHRLVAMRQDIYTTLVQAHEQSRIDAVRDTPVITVIASPQGSAEPEPRGTVLRTILALILGFILALFVAFIREFGRRARTEDGGDYREFNRLREEAWSDLTYPGRLLRRRARASSSSVG